MARWKLVAKNSEKPSKPKRYSQRRRENNGVAMEIDESSMAEEAGLIMLPSQP